MNINKLNKLTKTVDTLVAAKYGLKAALRCVIVSFGLTKEEATWLTNRYNH